MITLNAPGLGTIYLTYIFPNPDCAAINYIVPLEPIVPFDIFSVANDIRNQHLGENYSVDIPYLNTNPNDENPVILGIRIVYDHDVDVLNVFHYWTNSGTIDPAHVKLIVTYNFYLGTIDEGDKQICFMFWRFRESWSTQNLRDDGYFIITTNKTRFDKGVWFEPSAPTYPYGHMQYTLINEYTLLSMLPESEVCLDDSALSRSKQSRVVGDTYGKTNIAEHYFGDTVTIHTISNADGSAPDDNHDPNYDPNEGESGGNKGGDGQHNQRTDPIPIPDLPTIGAVDAGFITLYTLSVSDMQQFSSEMFDSSAWTAIKNLFANPMDFLCGCNLVPLTPHYTRTAKPKFGTYTWPHAYGVIDEQFYEINCGSVSLPKYYNNSYDNNPHTKLIIYLPYIGYKELNADEVIGNTLDVVYHVDIYSGACICFIYKDQPAGVGPGVPLILAQYTGNICVQVPVSQVSFEAMVSNAINILTAGAGIAAGVASGGSSTVAAAALGGATVSNITNMKPKPRRDGAIGSAGGYMGVQYPYIIREIPRLNLPSNYQQIKGYPCNMGGNLGAFSGYTEIDDIQVKNFSGTESELNEAIQLLKGGVIL